MNSFYIAGKNLSLSRGLISVSFVPTVNDSPAVLPLLYDPGSLQSRSFLSTLILLLLLSVAVLTSLKECVPSAMLSVPWVFSIILSNGNLIRFPLVT